MEYYSRLDLWSYALRNSGTRGIGACRPLARAASLAKIQLDNICAGFKYSPHPICADCKYGPHP